MAARRCREPARPRRDRKSTRLNSSHSSISYAVFRLKKKITFCVYTARFGVVELTGLIMLLSCSCIFEFPVLVTITSPCCAAASVTINSCVIVPASAVLATSSSIRNMVRVPPLVALDPVILQRLAHAPPVQHCCLAYRTIRGTAARVRAFIVRNRFFFNDTATTEIYTLSLHGALPI